MAPDSKLRSESDPSNADPWERADHDPIGEVVDRFAVRGEHLPPALRAMALHSRMLGMFTALDLPDRVAVRLRRVRAVVTAAFDAGLRPSAQGDAALEAADKAFRNYRTETARAQVLEAVRARDDFDQARWLLRKADDAFKRLDDSKLQRLLALAHDHPRGATKLGVHAVAAMLSLAVGAFGDTRKSGESEAAAIRRVSKAYRKRKAHV